MCVLEPCWNVTLFGPREQDRNEPVVPAAVLNELALQLLVDVHSVAGPLVALHADVSAADRLIISQTDDDDDQVIFLIEISLHTVNFTDAVELLLENIDVCVEAVVPQQRHKLDDLLQMLFTVRLVCHKHFSLFLWQVCDALIGRRSGV